MRPAIITLLLAAACQAQSFVLPARFMSLGSGYQSSGYPKITGWASVCARANSQIMTCGATDYTGYTSSVRLELDTMLAHMGALTLFSKTGAGAATGSVGSLGGSFTGGFVAILKINKVVSFLGPDTHLVLSATWIKNNVGQPASAQSYRSLGQQVVFRLGFGSSF